ncbi:MAG: HAD hydrolase-like protein, partial [Usitatibacter sp.]
MTSSPAPIRAVILDLDGTLVDSAGEIGVALNETLAELGVRPMSLEAVKALIGRGVRSLVERALELQGAVADIDREVKRFEAHYGRTVATHATLFPGVKDGLAALRDEGIELAVVTNKPRAFTERLLR